MASTLISLHDATVAHADGLPLALQDISLSIEHGDWIALRGANGSGKTTLLAALGGVLPLRAGEIERAPGLRVALLLQEPDNQLVASTVAREIALSVPRDVGDNDRRARLDAGVARFELGDLLDRNPHRLSGGEKQRLVLATVWLESPDVLLLDEPLSFLDDEMRARAVSFVRELNANGVAIVWATPGGDEVSLARDVIDLREGRMISGRSGAPAHSRVLSPATPEPPRSARSPGPRPVPPASAPTRLSFESVSFSYDKTHVLRDVTMGVKEGECVCVTGRNGSGKSTLLLLAGGALQPSSGRVTRHTGEHGVLYLPQSPERLFFAETVLEEVAYGLARRGVPRAETAERARAALVHAGLDPDRFSARSPFELSFGEMRRVAFAVAYALEPELLLLDEPASCLDDAGRTVLGDLVGYSAGRGSAVLLATHDAVHPGANGRVVTLEGGRAGHGPGGSPLVDAGQWPG